MAINMEFEQSFNQDNIIMILSNNNNNINNNTHYQNFKPTISNNKGHNDNHSFTKDSANEPRPISPNSKPSRKQLRKTSSLVVLQETKTHPLNNNTNTKNNIQSNEDILDDDCSSDCECNYSDDQSSASDEVSYNSYSSSPIKSSQSFLDYNNNNRNYTCSIYKSDEFEDSNNISMSVSSSISSLITTPISFNESISSLSTSPTIVSINNSTRSSSIPSSYSTSPISTKNLPRSSLTSFASQSISLSTVSSQISIRSSPPNNSLTSSTDSLYSILRNSKSKDETTKSKFTKSLVSNLTTSVQNLKNSTKDKLISFISDSPRLTDDKLPFHKQQKEESKEIEEPVHQSSEELITFSEVEHEHDTILPENATAINNNNTVTRTIFKNRDQRINSQFLRLYAYDYNSRINTRTLPNSLTQEDLYSMIRKNPNLKKFHQIHNIYKISNLSREKLWNSVVLKPRLDDSPQEFIDSENYIFITSNLTSKDNHKNAGVLNRSITRKQGKYLPWDLKPSIKPCGILKGGKWEFNGKAPNSGVTKTQYTVKGWCNSRWVDCS
ncbi:hypothetical protein KGF54_003528 [Candida jiufengensis]|uniref:uncharacterized protein n=1 Tax=Candida jiufengensis TaxID=497108 RepID=UPI0022252F80|nr:uncharacterized protein KGF54_003528 [Candida jiufengensis]KAI5952661.1 hypothetical protein KGF54_003528 [Candida jiufengensis]